MSKLLNLTKLSEHTEIKKRTLYRMIEDGRFDVEPVRNSNPRLWNIEDVNKWMKSK